MRQKYQAKAFQYISLCDKITVLQLGDSGIGGYRVRVWNWLQNIREFEDKRIDLFRQRSKRHRKEKERKKPCK